MKRLWLGLFILIFLLLGGLIIHTGLHRIHHSISTDLEQAAQAAAQQQWDSALHLARTATDRWQRYHRFTAAFSDHTPMDTMDALFVQLPIFAEKKEDPHFAAACRELSFYARALAESHTLSWWNFL